MKTIVTLTLNPVIDVSCEADEVRHTDKIRTHGERIEPGGGGINVARALCGFDAPVKAIYLKGGISGRQLDELLEVRCMARVAVEIGDSTRTSLNVRERSTGLEYRFVPEGPDVSAEEWQACRDAIGAVDCDFFVASGSLARGLADDSYAALADDLQPRGTRVILDTSGAELAAALENGGLFMVKPSRNELEEILGTALPTAAAVAEAGQRLVESGKAALVAVTLGRDGAVLSSGDGAYFLPALPIEPCSTVGAGDSFVAAMTYGFASGLDTLEAFRLGVAAGAAAVQAPGPELCRASDVERILDGVGQPERLA